MRDRLDTARKESDEARERYERLEKELAEEREKEKQTNDLDALRIAYDELKQQLENEQRRAYGLAEEVSDIPSLRLLA